MTHYTYYTLLTTTTEFTVREGDDISQMDFIRIIVNVVNSNVIYKQPVIGPEILRASGVVAGQVMELLDAIVNVLDKLSKAYIEWSFSSSSRVLEQQIHQSHRVFMRHLIMVICIIT